MNETWWVNQDQLDGHQLSVLTEPPETELLIVGPPGSGKTNLLLLRANYVHDVGPRLLFLTFTRTLAEFLRSGPNIGRADQIQPSDIRTFMRWATDIIRENGGEIPEDKGEFEDRRRSILDALENVVASGKLRNLYDFAFVDEVQDFWARELDIVRVLANRINAAGDARQRIWHHREGLAKAAELTSKKAILEKHYRIGEKICHFADRILPPVEGTVPLLDGCNYPEELRGSSVGSVRCNSLTESYAECLSLLKEQIRYISEEPIGVLAHTRQVRDGFWQALLDDGDLVDIAMCQQENNYQKFSQSSRVRVMTVHSAKGSEFRAVHILNAEAFKEGNRELAFTAVTRAKTEVMLYSVSSLAGHMTPHRGQLPRNLNSLF